MKMPDSVSAWRKQLPVPILPARPDWIDLYWRAWALFLADPAAVPSDAAQSAGDAIATLRRQGRHDQADELAAQRLDELAGALGQTAVPRPAAPITLAEPTIWSPLHWPEPAVLLIAQVIGLALSPSEQRVRWRLRQEPPVGLRNLRLTRNRLSLAATAEVGGGVMVVVETVQPLELEIATEFILFSEQVPAGRTRYLLTHLDRTDVRQV